MWQEGGVTVLLFECERGQVWNFAGASIRSRPRAESGTWGRDDNGKQVFKWMNHIYGYVSQEIRLGETRSVVELYDVDELNK